MYNWKKKKLQSYGRKTCDEMSDFREKKKCTWFPSICFPVSSGSAFMEWRMSTIWSVRSIKVFFETLRQTKKQQKRISNQFDKINRRVKQIMSRSVAIYFRFLEMSKFTVWHFVQILKTKLFLFWNRFSGVYSWFDPCFFFLRMVLQVSTITKKHNKTRHFNFLLGRRSFSKSSKIVLNVNSALTLDIMFFFKMKYFENVWNRLDFQVFKSFFFLT